MKTILTTLTAALALLFAPAALADVAPDPGDDDDDDVAQETCTAENQEGELTGFTCEECVAEGGGTCAADYDGTNYELVCFDEAGDATTEVWCTEDTGPSCAVMPGGRSLGIAAALLGLGVAALVRTRRSG